MLTLKNGIIYFGQSHLSISSMDIVHSHNYGGGIAIKQVTCYYPSTQTINNKLHEFLRLIILLLSFPSYLVGILFIS